MTIVLSHHCESIVSIIINKYDLPFSSFPSYNAREDEYNFILELKSLYAHNL